MGKPKKEEKDESSSSSSAEDVKPAKPAAAATKGAASAGKGKPAAKPAAKKASSASSSSEDEPKKAAAKPAAKPAPAATKKAAAPAKKAESSDSSEEKPKSAKKAAPAKKKSSSSSSEEQVKPAKPVPKGGKPAKDSDASSSGEESEDAPKKAAPVTSDKKRKADGAAGDETPSKKAKTQGEEGITRVFVGNLPYTINDEQIRSFFAEVGEIKDIHWVTDKTTGKFYGNGFIEFETPDEARAAVAKAGSDVGGRAIKVDLAQPRTERKPAGGGFGERGGDRGGDRGGFDKREPRGPTPKPDGCTTVFLGNLSYSIDEDTIRNLFSDCGEITSIRWVEKDGQFRGCGFVDFAATDATDAAVAKNGQDVMGRAIRVDFSAPRPPRQ
jgi:nucleolin